MHFSGFSSSLMNPGSVQRHVWLLSVFSQVWSHPPLSSAHSSISEGIEITDSRLEHGYRIQGRYPGVATETRVATQCVPTGLVTPTIVISTLVDIWGNRDYRNPRLGHGYTIQGRYRGTCGYSVCSYRSSHTRHCHQRTRRYLRE